MAFVVGSSWVGGLWQSGKDVGVVWRGRGLMHTGVVPGGIGRETFGMRMLSGSGQDGKVSGPSRRGFLDRVMAGVLAIVLPKPARILMEPALAGAEVDYGAVRKDISEVVLADLNRGPTLVRLAWHSSGTFDKMNKTGGSGKGTIRLKEELQHGANAGLGNAIAWLEPVKKKHPNLSYADLFTLAGVVAIRNMGGPDIAWRAGRRDSMDPMDVTEDGRLPEASKGADHLRKIFYRMGFNDQEIVCLAGAHALGRAHREWSGYEGPWTATPIFFSNAFYRFLLFMKWTPREWDGPHQYTDEFTGKFMMLPTDIALIEDPEFRKYVELYAQDRYKFFDDFAKVFQKLEELGTENLHNV